MDLRTWVLGDEEGQPKGVCGVSTDITEHEHTEKAKKATEEWFKSLADLSPFPISVIDSGDRYLYINPKFIELFGYTLADIPSGRDWFDRAFPDPDYRHKVIATWKMSQQGANKGWTFWVVCKDGKTREVLFRSGLKEGGKQFIIYEDITDQRAREDERIKAAKLESLSLLAGGIAHDFNNILTGIVGNVTLAKMQAKPGEKIFERLSLAEKACHRARDLTQQLHTFAKGGAPVKSIVALSEVISESATLVLKQANIKCQISVSDDLWTVEADRGQISQVLHNLIINAEQALPEGGLIEIFAENMNTKAEHGLLNQDGRYVKITVRDHGIGIPLENFPKIFDPYFTTKKGGTGLGLATSHSIITKHEGHILMESELGLGTSFYIYLPAFQKEPLEKRRSDAKTSPASASLVEDSEISNTMIVEKWEKKRIEN